MRVIEDLGAEHDELRSMAGNVRRAIEGGRRIDARRQLEDLVDLLRSHTDVEEASVFAALRAAGELGEHVKSLAEEHTAVWAQLDAADSRAWDRTVLAVLDDLADHIAREEYDLFPAAVVALDPSAWDEAEAAADGVRRRSG